MGEHVRNKRGQTSSVGVKPFLPMKDTVGGYGQVSPSITVRYLQSSPTHRKVAMLQLCLCRPAATSIGSLWFLLMNRSDCLS